MKRLIGMLAMIGIMMTSCESVTDPGDEVEGCITVRMIANICGDAVLQVLDPDFHGIETVDWTDQGTTYENTIYTLMSCGTPEAYYETGAIFSIRISDTPTAENELCLRCAATFANPPTVRYHTEIVESCNDLTN